MTGPLLALLLAAGSPDAGPAMTGHEHHHAADSTQLPDAASTESIYNVTSTWTDASGKRLQLKSFAGSPVVVSMIYTSCPAICPMIVSDMQRLERELPPNVRGKVRFVVISFDPVRDTPQRLAQYAKERRLPSRWTLLTGAADDVRELAAVLGMRYRATDTGDFAHSTLITVLDAKGVVLQRLVGLRQDPASAVSALVAATKVK